MRRELFGIRPSFLMALSSLALAVGQFRLLQLTMPFFDYQVSIGESLAVLDGNPTWIMYQSRILGPLIVLVLSKLTNNFVTAHVLFFVIFHALAGFLVVFLASRRANAVAGWLAFWMFQALFALLLMNGWLFAWDNVGIIIFIVFVYFVLTEKSWYFFVSLFVVAIFNRESAFYIGLWMVISPLCDVFFGRRAATTARFNWQLLVAGLGCIGFGWLCIHLLRSYLLVQEMGPLLYRASPGEIVQIRWENNLQFLWRALNPSWNESTYSFGMESAVGLFLLYLLGTITRVGFLDGGRWAALSFAHFALYLSVLIFASLRETRVLLEFLPLLVFSKTAMTGDLNKSMGPPISRPESSE